MRESNPPRQREKLASYADRRTGHIQCDEQELNLQILKGWLGYGQLGLPMPNRRMLFSGAGETRTRRSRRFELRRFADLRTAPFSKRPRRDLDPRSPA